MPRIPSGVLYCADCDPMYDKKGNPRSIAMPESSDVIYAMEHCAPSNECKRCKENIWQFVSLSPNKKSATYRCDYCNRKEIVIAHSEKVIVPLNLEAVLTLQALGESKSDAVKMVTEALGISPNATTQELVLMCCTKGEKS
jgi:hypothetical protein